MPRYCVGCVAIVPFGRPSRPVAFVEWFRISTAPCGCLDCSASNNHLLIFQVGDFFLRIEKPPEKRIATAQAPPWAG